MRGGASEGLARDSIANSSVLVVDDELLVARMIGASIRRWTAKVDVVAGVREAEAFLGRECPPPTVVLLDWRLPDGDPARVVDLLIRRSAATGVVLMTGDRELGHDVGSRLRADDVLYKPFGAAQLREALDRGIVACSRRAAIPSVIQVIERVDDCDSRADQNFEELVAVFRPYLTERQYVALRLRLLGFPDETIARELGITSPGAAGNLYRRALARLGIEESDAYGLLRALARLLGQRLELGSNSPQTSAAEWLSQLVADSAHIGAPAREHAGQ